MSESKPEMPELSAIGGGAPPQYPPVSAARASDTATPPPPELGAVRLRPAEYPSGRASDFADMYTPLTPVQIAFSFSGRISRATYWTGMLGVLLISAAAGALIAPITDHMGIGWALLMPVYALSTWISLAIQVKRWHDLGRSGWYVLCNCIPLLNIFAIVVALGMFPGDDGPNEYGPQTGYTD